MNSFQYRYMHYWLRWTLYSSISGLFAGLSASLFLYLLSKASNYRDQHLSVIWLLPLAGFFIGWIYHKYGRSIAKGNDLVIEQTHNPTKKTPLRMAPFILIGTVITHFFGGSAGREGTAVQMGAGLSDQLTQFGLSNQDRKILLRIGSGAGFGAAIGAPIAGVIFGMEVLFSGRFKIESVYQSTVASVLAYWTTLLLKAPHTDYPIFTIPNLSLQNIFYILIAGLCFGLAARFFNFYAKTVKVIFQNAISYPPLRPFVGGLLLVLLFYIEGSYRYIGLGIPTILEALTAEAQLHWPLLKALFTGLTVSSGFKGGEFIPLVFVGSTLGSALALYIPLNFKLLAAIGFGAVFGAASNTPIACAVMVAEIFGWQILPYALIGCFVAYFITQDIGIYSSQKVRGGKWLNIFFRSR